MTRQLNIRGMRAAHEAKGTVIRPNKPLNPLALNYFEDMTSVRAFNDWSRADIVALTRISDWLARADDLQRQLDSEGEVVVNERGTPIVNPKFSLVDQLERRIIGAIAKLSIHTMSTAGAKVQNLAKRAENAKKVQDQDDDLIG